DLKISDPRQEGHDEVNITSATLLADGRTVFLEIPDLRPVMQLAVGFVLKAHDGAPIRQTLHCTIHEVGTDTMAPRLLARANNSYRLSKSEQDKLRPGLIVHFEQPWGQEDARVSRLASLFVSHNAAPTPFLFDGVPFSATFEGFLRTPLRGNYSF